jgi:FHS family glucose/mannose:H+ symporter-like MFS transporter
MMSGVYSITLVYANHSIPNNAHLVTPTISGLSGLGAAVFPAFTGYSIDNGGMLSTLWYLVGIGFTYLFFLLVVNHVRKGVPFAFPHLFKNRRPRLAFAARRSRYK